MQIKKRACKDAANENRKKQCVKSTHPVSLLSFAISLISQYTCSSYAAWAQCSRVCKQWKQVMTCQNAFKHLVLSHIPMYKVPNHSIKFIQVLKLNMRSTSRVQKNRAEQLIEQSIGLRYLSITCYISLKFTINHTNILYLSLASSLLTVKDAACLTLLSSLNTLYLTDVYGLNHATLDKLSRMNIEILHIANCPIESSINYLDFDIIRWPKLESLTLSECWGFNDGSLGIFSGTNISHLRIFNMRFHLLSDPLRRATNISLDKLNLPFLVDLHIETSLFYNTSVFRATNLFNLLQLYSLLSNLSFFLTLADCCEMKKLHSQLTNFQIQNVINFNFRLRQW